MLTCPTYFMILSRDAIKTASLEAIEHVPDTSRTIAGCVGGNVESFSSSELLFASVIRLGV